MCRRTTARSGRIRADPDKRPQGRAEAPDVQGIERTRPRPNNYRIPRQSILPEVSRRSTEHKSQALDPVEPGLARTVLLFLAQPDRTLHVRLEPICPHTRLIDTSESTGYLHSADGMDDQDVAGGFAGYFGR